MMKKGKKKKKKKDLTRLWTLSSLSGKKRKKKRSRKKATARFNRMIATANRSITLGDLKNAEEILLELAQTERWSEHRRHVHSSHKIRIADSPCRSLGELGCLFANSSI